MKARERYAADGASDGGGGGSKAAPRANTQHRGSVAHIGSGSLFAGHELTKSHRVEALLFPVFYALCEKEREKSSFDKMVGPVLWVPDVFQLLALCIQGTAWHPSAVKWIDVLGNFSTIILNAMGSAGFYALFWLSAVLVMLALTDTAFVAFLFRVRPFHWWPGGVLHTRGSSV